MNLVAATNESEQQSAALGPVSQPVLSAIMVMPRSFHFLTASLSCLARQSIKDQIELVIVHRAAYHSGIDAAAGDGFHSVKLISMDRVPTVAAGFVAGVAAASAPVVALVEDHVFLHPQWAERVVEAHRQGCAAVVPKMTNGNPATVASWANFLTCFCEPFAVRTDGPIESGPGHNTSYKRAVLHSYGDDLQSLYQSERNFHYRLRQDGHAIVAAPRAELAHVNISIPRKVLAHAFFGGVLFGQYRSVNMSLVERLLRTFGVPLVPPLRCWRIARTLGFRQLVNPDGPRAALLVAPILLIAHATGEVAGYWRLVPHVEAHYEHYELHRVECIRQEERSLLTERRST